MPIPNLARLASPRRMRKLGSRVRRAAQFEAIAHARRQPIDRTAVLYEAFSGNGMLDNPEALFRGLLATPDLGHLRHVWVLAGPRDFPATVAEFAGHPRVSFVTYRSYAYFRALATSKYLVNNATFPAQFAKRPGQVYLNTWHGTPLKAMGYDVPDGALDTRNVVRNLLAADYLLAPNDDTAEMYLHGYRMRNIFRGALIGGGTPRVDRQFAPAPVQARVRHRLRAAGVDAPDDRQIILYAPTWRGSFYAPDDDISELRARVEAMSRGLDATRYRVLLKVHQQVYQHAVTDDALRRSLVPNEIPTNDVLSVTDVLVTDYSSIFIDFLATGRPVLFLAPDLAEYAADRGFYLPVERWPGPVHQHVDGLVADLKALGSGGPDDPALAYADRHAAARERYCATEDGAATERVIDVVFRGRSAGHDVRRGFGDGRISVLVHLGGMLANGITSSALSLLDNIDHDRVDVTATFPYTNSATRRRLIAMINPAVRVLPRIGGMNGTKVQVTTLLAVRRRTPAQQAASLQRYSDLLRDEWERCFGDAQFDHVVDFSGYAPFWVKLLSSRSAGTLSVWMHNDIRAEMENPGRSAWLRSSLSGMTGLYRYADSLVSVSAALRDVNRERLADVAPADRFTFARNTINAQRILQLARETPVEPEAGASRDILTNLTAGSAALTLSDILPEQPGVRTFVTAGRLSAEKNQARLVRAFAAVHREDPKTRLVILGTGPQRQALMELVAGLGLTTAVTLAGHQPNPYVVIANCDCFVLSSDYEGQPMVLLEALILARPIVTTDFASVRGALPEGYGLVVERTVPALADGMRAYLRGDVPTRAVDPERYNHEATAEFYRAVGMELAPSAPSGGGTGGGA